MSRSHRLEQHMLAQTLRKHPEWSLEDLLGYIARGRGLAAALGKLTVSDLLVEPDAATLLADAMSPVRSEDCRVPLRAEFDQLVFEVLCETPDEVASGYLRARLGGPRWKMQDSLRRLVAAGRVIRGGTTSATRYRAVRA